MRVLILGGTSLTGPHTVRRLHALGHEVTVFHRGTHEADLPPGVRHVHGEFTHPPRELFHPAPDAILHMWLMTEAGARAFVDTFRGVSGRVVVISSGDVYHAYGCLQRLETGPPDPAPLTEAAPLRQSRFPYRKIAPDGNHWMAHYDKILVERIVMDAMPAVILRFPAVIGPAEHRRFDRWVGPMLRGEAEVRIQQDWSDWRWTHGFAADVAEAAVLAVTHPSAAGIYNVGESRTPTMTERLADFARVAGWRGRIRTLPAAELPDSDRLPHDFAHHLVYDTTRIRTELGYTEVLPYQESLARFIRAQMEPSPLE